MNKLTIYRLYFTNSDCYKTAPSRKAEGIQVHCTVSGNPYLKRYVQPDDGRLGPNKYNNSHNRPNVTVCANAYIGKLDDGTVAVYQTLPWDKRTWLSASGSKGNANKMGYIGFETCCLLTDEPYFKDAVMDKAVKLVAYWCKLYGFKPYDEGPCGLRVMDHSELHRAGYASNHADITNWLKEYGYTMNDFRNAVERVLKEGIEVEIIDAAPKANHPTLRKGAFGEEVRYMQQLLANAGSGLAVDGKFGSGTLSAVKAFQNKHGLAADGVVGPLTWAQLLKYDDGADEQPFEPEEETDIYTDVDGEEVIDDVKFDAAIKKLQSELDALAKNVAVIKKNLQTIIDALNS